MPSELVMALLTASGRWEGSSMAAEKSNRLRSVRSSDRSDSTSTVTGSVLPPRFSVMNTASSLLSVPSGMKSAELNSVPSWVVSAMKTTVTMPVAAKMTEGRRTVAPPMD